MSKNKTPLRYPGGKQKLAGFVLEILQANDLVGGDYCEPYAGGAGVAVELLLARKVRHVHLNDCCRTVYAFWRSILTKTEEFCRRISTVPLTIPEWRRQREILTRASEFSQFEVGFSAFYLNRCNRSGIVTGGVIGGLDQTGTWKIDARFPRQELIRRVEAIAAMKKSITVKDWDAEGFITEYVSKLPDKTLVYCDPPYFHKADRLYLNHYQPADHSRLAEVIQGKLKKPWIVSYDAAPEIIKGYVKRTSFTYQLQYNAGKAYKGSELFVFSDDLQVPKSSSTGFIQDGLTAFQSK
jgi:DNA adenine methylase